MYTFVYLRIIIKFNTELKLFGRFLHHVVSLTGDRVDTSVDSEFPFFSHDNTDMSWYKQSG